MELHGWIGVSADRVGRAYKVAAHYIKQHGTMLDESYEQALEVIANKHIGKRSVSKAMFLVPVSNSEAKAIAEEQLSRDGEKAYDKAFKVLGRKSALAFEISDNMKMMRKYVDELQLIFESGEESDVILLDLHTCKVINDILRFDL